ncbi:MAG TPA: tetratricopeptide repeat protein [Dehalococcoidia bacterium]|nr:tetratricopeptide repeat protein [Dehalococcoidia bacterium]
MVALPSVERVPLDEEPTVWPTSVRNRVEKADRLAASGLLEEALREEQTALKSAPDDEYLLNNIGATLARLDRKREALLFFERALEVDPDNSLVLRNVGFVLFELGEVKRALETLSDRNNPMVKDALRIVLDLHLQYLVDAGFAEWGGGKPTGSEPPIPVTPGPPISDYVIEDRR